MPKISDFGKPFNIASNDDGGAYLQEPFRAGAPATGPYSQGLADDADQSRGQGHFLVQIRGLRPGWLSG